MTPRPSTAAPVLAVFAAIAVLLALYVGGYFWLGTYESTAGWPIHDDPNAPPAKWVRVYSNQWLATVYDPLAWVESLVTGEEGYAAFTP